MLRSIPGDETFSETDWFYDDDIFIEGKTGEIWPWLVQMGNGRAGWYSYDWLDNLGKASFQHIDSSLQDLEINQKISIFTVESFKENLQVTLRYSKNCNMTWFLEAQGAGTLLTTRLRVKGPRWLLSATLGPGHLFMQRKQFKEIKKRVEQNQSSKGGR